MLSSGIASTVGRASARAVRGCSQLTFPTVLIAFLLAACGPTSAPAPATPTQSLYAREQVQAGRDALLASDYAAAETAARAAVEEAPEWILPRELLARALAKQGRSVDAESELRAAITAYPEQPTPRFLLAMLLELRGDSDAATALYREARERYDNAPDDAETGIERAVNEYLYRGRPAGLEAIGAMLARFPGHPRALQIEAQIRERQRDLFLTDMRAAAEIPARPRTEEE